MHSSFVTVAFDDAGSCSDYITSNVWMMMINEMERMSNDAVITSFKVISRRMPGELNIIVRNQNSRYPG
jgi:hypothetical protein